MRTLLIAAVALSAMTASPILAKEDPKAPAATEDAATHEMCKSVMGRDMQPRQPHDHAREKSGMVTWPNGKPLSKAEMARMHKRCAEKMAKPEPAK